MLDYGAIVEGPDFRRTPRRGANVTIFSGSCIRRVPEVNEARRGWLGQHHRKIVRLDISMHDIVSMEKFQAIE